MCCLQGTTLSAQKIVNFVRQRQAAVRKLTLMNSEGYWSGEAQGVHQLLDKVNLLGTSCFWRIRWGQKHQIAAHVLEDIAVPAILKHASGR